MQSPTRLTLLGLLVSACASDKTSPDVADTSSEVSDATPDADPGETTGDVGETNDLGDTTSPNPWGAPLDPASPWPKFRRDLAQTGRSDVMPNPDPTRARWVFETSKGIFSTAVIGGDGTVYIGSADRYFYALDAMTGQPKWRFETAEIIDSSALLDDAGRVVFGSGDGHVYALDRADGTELWRFAADEPSVTGAFIRWFEGNIGILPDGALIAPNDNFCTYAIERATGTKRWCFTTLDQTWSLPAVNVETGRLFIGNNFYFGQNVFAIDPATGTSLWTASTQGSVAASPLLLGTAASDLVVLGAFDGYVRAFRQDTGAQAWETPVRDHVYASPGLLADGTIIQPGADGTVYALSPATGDILWGYDIGAPIRSSPAIDGAGNIYVGAGDGRLWVITSGGALAWSLQLATDDRNDLNASPALGRDGVVIAGESGEIFFVPWGFCQRTAEADNPDCLLGPGEQLPEDGTAMRLTTRFGTVLPAAGGVLEPNEPITLSLEQREDGDTVLAVIDEASLVVTITPARETTIVVAGDRRFASIVPEEPWADAEGDTLTVRVQGQSLVAPFTREGLKLSGGEAGETFDQTFTFTVAARGGAALPLAIPAAPGEAHGVWELARLAAPLPTILPSYNQIGFDSVHYLVGIVPSTTPGRGLAWAIGALPTNEGTVVDPASRVRFPLALEHDGTMLTLDNEVGFGIDFNGFTLPFARFRVAGTIDAAGAGAQAFTVFALAICEQIDFYGVFLRQLGFCNPESDVLAAAGAVELLLVDDAATPASGVGEVAWSTTTVGATTTVEAELTGSTLVAAEHNLGIVVLDAAGLPLACDYVEGTSVEVDGSGHPTRVGVKCPSESAIAKAFLMVDVGAVAEGGFVTAR